MKLRNINIEDANSVLDIYSPFIRESSVTFENDIPTAKDFRQRIIDYTKKFPWLIAEEDTGTLVGYAYASTYRERKAYQWVVESSIYIHKDYKRKNIGKILYSKLFSILKLQGIYKVFAVITLPNPASISFHESIGFQKFTTYHDIGYKLGKWCDVGWWELVLQSPAIQPKNIIPFPELDVEKVTEILDMKY
jgi:L-amino acid N-acyltransferase YncA